VNTLVSADDTWTLWAIILVGVAVSIRLEQRYRWAARISGPVLGLLIAMTLSELGSYLLYVLLFAIGLPADLWQVIKNVPMMFAFCLIMAVVNLLVTLGLGKLLRLNLEELLLCVNAALGGAPSAAAMAVASGWPNLVLPALLVGIWGYAVGTFIGLVVGELLLRLV
jgi:uncharacterized membrane protein